jgi:hypothetical protein
MKNLTKVLAFAVATGLVVACSSRENSAQSTPESMADSVETVAPSADGMPTDGSSPSNAGSPPDSAAQAIDQDSTLNR